MLTNRSLYKSHSPKRKENQLLVKRECYLDLGSEDSEWGLHNLSKICWTKFPKSNQITEQMAEISEQSLNSLSKYE